MAKVISRETMLIGIVAVLAGLAVTYGVRLYLTPEEVPAPAEQPPAPEKKVPLANVDLPAERVLTEGDIVIVSMTKQQFQDRFKGMDPELVAASASSLLHRRLKDPIKRGQPFLYSKLYLEGTGPSITKKLQPGFQAVRVQVPDTREGGVQAGTFVDVIFRATARPAKNGQVAIPEQTLTLMRHIEVLEAEPAPVAGRPNPRAAGEARTTLVTLAVPVEKADMFAVIEGRGDLWLVPTKDAAQSGPITVVPDASTLQGLLGITPPHGVPPQPQPQPPFETLIYRGGHMQVNQFIDGKLVVSQATGGWGQGTRPRRPPEPVPPGPPAR